jgi:peptidoglycan/LPS O-acetylase OafA/YrhL
LAARFGIFYFEKTCGSLMRVAQKKVQTEGPGRLKSLDILRGIAILLVVFHHINNGVIPSCAKVSGAAGFAFWKIKDLGWAGVDLFFVLSGFLVGGLLLREIQRDGRFRFVQFVVRREFKILPSYYFLLLVLACTGATGFVNQESSRTAINSVFVHAFFLQNYVDQLPNGPTWSLAVEEHFYILFPMILIGMGWVARKRKSDPLASIPIVAGSIFVGCLLLRIVSLHNGLYRDDFMLSHYRFGSLFVGVFCQYLWMRHRERVRSVFFRVGLWLPVAAGLILPAFFYSRRNPAMFTIGFSFLAIGSAILLMLVLVNGLGRFEQSRLASSIALIGRCSYNIYLWHCFLPLIDPVVYPVIQIYLGTHIPWAPLALMAQGTVYIALAVLGGWVFTCVIETPFLRLRKRLFQKREKAVPLDFYALEAGR